ncbi:putative rhamnulose-1-phosphate aldolase / Predicted lactaldehyde dehydrogenase [Pseudonocardia sp. Ae168_Ps1]|uniref:bifunctional rhamnulose-1-phosphate aldolase/short-chain dehydrogenase n=2 Tax=unclassified Pseudonocardia TaxID=2619320 RepID=UPI0001FFF3F5|nr:putative rhamnulose-1-phosphate aldolase / Predicted lactaldehyde dehydrogenase [Pseudonocardia sp. Ae150A_Ps1]OLL79890.1 putative rhamnulose-1-phosphate aldolase / Predicted lactaldehyde dehydrogenase [Pseudonocardia sp. Ae168_Ps1]OLL85977.1 putative rhamnulose-1-phosphate aldolase / Predicted lactaldehyde dehydrogenase [Pseudonocardia sp. Ae263_Ps1]OLL93993.1 putative rhamnulose-1-phosphate aldolase / Predicted lactaldehyde dehydrogenase [Pseudonocardia sp. Ae356_Ps1]OLM20512.1 putative rh
MTTHEETMSPHPVVADLIARSNRLGADPATTNYAGGNTSAKGTATDPVTGGDVELVWVKGSGGDLGTLTASGLAALRLDRLRSLVGTYPGVEREDEMVAAFDYCLHGRGGAAPSIDTAMHGLVTAPHVDHLHPDAGIAIACAADGEALTKEIFGDRVQWVPWRRPGFQLGLDIAAVAEANPQAIGVVLGGHGITAWGDDADACEAHSLEIIRTAQAYLDTRGAAEPFGPVRPGYEALADAERRAKAAALAPVVRGLASTDRAQVGHFTDSPVVLDFLSREKLGALAELGTSCPDHFLRTKVKPLVVDLPADAGVEETVARLRELHETYREGYRAYYDRHADAGSPAIRGADPAVVLVPGVGMFSFGATKQTARVAGEFYVNAINVMRGAEAVSRYAPIDEAEKFRIEYWALEEAKLQRMPAPKPLAARVALVTGAASGIGKAVAQRLAAEGACVVVADLDAQQAADTAAALGGTDVAIGVAADVSSADGVVAAFAAGALAFGGIDLVVNNAGLSISKPLLETTEHDWDLQHDVMAKGSFLVSREAARTMIAQGTGGDIVYISSKNAVFAGPDNVAYGATKADQAHQVRLLAAELGGHGIRVNGINPDGVVRGSGIFAGGWGAQRAAVYGVEESELGEFYAQRTILKREVLPEHVAAAVFALTGGDLTRTTGLHVPVDSGVAAAFLR